MTTIWAEPSTTYPSTPDRAVPPTLDPARIPAATRRYWRRGCGRRVSGRRAEALALFGVSSGFDPALETVSAVVRTAGRDRAQRVVDRAARADARRARRVDRLMCRLGAVRQRADSVGTGVVLDPDGSAVTVEQLVADHDVQVAEVRAATRGGDRRHRRSRLGSRVLAALLPWLDAVLFTYFIAGVSNADPSAPLTTPVASAVALGLALLVVLAVAGFTPWLGRHLRHHKDGDGELHWADLGPVAVGLIGLWAILLVALGATMVVRVLAEATAAGADTVTGGVVAGLLAVAAVALNVLVLVVAFGDGTALTDGLAGRARTMRRTACRRDALVRRWTRLGRRALRIVRRGGRARVLAMGRAERVLARHEEMLQRAALRAGVGVVPGIPMTTGELDLSGLVEQM